MHRPGVGGVVRANACCCCMRISNKVVLRCFKSISHTHTQPPCAGGTATNSSTLLCLGSTCYAFHSTLTTHAAAWANCYALGGHMWYAKSEHEALAVQVYFGLVNAEDRIILGLNRTSGASTWVTSDGAPLSYTHW